MIWKNPFLTKNNEQQNSFLSLFESSALDMIEERHFSGISYILGTPGAGKTSLFKAFSNEILAENQNEDNKDYFSYMKKSGIIKNGKVKLLSGYLSFARNYSIIEEMFENGKRTYVSFALLNYRIVISLMRGIEKVFDWSIEDYDKLTFINLPEEMEAEEEQFINGKTLYEWACRGERDLCRYLDGDRLGGFSISFVHTTLIILKLFEPGNLLINGEQYFERTLMIFDDFHKLAPRQQKYIPESIMTLKTTTSVWIGRRLEGLKNEQIVSLDGSLDRDYNLPIIIDEYWSTNKSVKFYNMAQKIADRRVKESQLEIFTHFDECICDGLDLKKYNKRLKDFCAKIDEQIDDDNQKKTKYANIINYIKTSDQMNEMDKAIWYECILIMERRNQTGQLSLFLGIVEKLDDFKLFVGENEQGAKFYVCQKCDIPFYHGIKNLEILSSYNVQQFLVFAGAYFDNCYIKQLGSTKKKKKNPLSAEEQRDILTDVVRQRWNDMDFRYKQIAVIKRFLTNIGELGKGAIEKGKNSYAGGAYTGIAIRKTDLQNNISKSKYKKLVYILGACMASRYLERRTDEKSDEIKFYLNRWLCVYFGLPLSYGGFKRCSMDKLLEMCQEENAINDEQMTLWLEGDYNETF